MAVCRHCGQENPDGFRFCGSCGSQLAALSQNEERKVVTVLFADLVGFTSRSERMDVEDVRGTLAPYHALRAAGVRGRRPCGRVPDRCSKRRPLPSRRVHGT